MRSFLLDLRKYGAVFLTIVVIAIALRVYFFGGYVGLDDAEYTRLAYQMAKDQSINSYNGPAVFPLRVGVIFPTSLAFRFFGFGELSAVVYPFVLSIIGLLFSYICASGLFNHRIGLIAAALYAIIPLDVISATQLLPDLPAALYASLGITTILLFMRFPIEDKSILFFGGLFAGLAFGLSWLCKETVSYFVLTCAVFMIMSLKRSFKSGAALWTGVIIGSLLILLGEMIVYQNVMGDWLFRFHEIERNYHQWENGFFSEGSDFGWPKGGSHTIALIKRIVITGPAFILLNSQFIFLPLLGIIASIHALYWKDRAFVLPSVWLITLLLMFNCSSSSVTSYSPLPLFNRYFYPILFPAIVLTSGLLGNLICHDHETAGSIHRERRFWGVMLISFLVLIGGGQLYWQERTPLTWTSEVRAIGSIVKPSSYFYSDILTIRGLEFFSGYPAYTAWIDFEELKSMEEMQPGSLVLVNRRYIAWLNKNGGMWLSKRSGYKKHEFYDHPPQSWKRIFENENAVLYEVS
jgi:4-amino-4-deoxy-L-arabinose transferase-like glycosyltransferase